MTLEELKEHHLQLEFLTKSEGWALLRREMEMARDHAYKMMMSDPSEVSVHRSVGAYHVARSLLSWPEREMEATRKQIEVLEKGGGNQWAKSPTGEDEY